VDHVALGPFFFLSTFMSPCQYHFTNTPYSSSSTSVLANPRPLVHRIFSVMQFNPLTPNDDCSGRTAQLTSKRCILYIYSTNIGNEYFKHGIYCPFFSLQNTACLIILTYLVPVLFTFYIQGVLKLKKNNSGAKRLTKVIY